MSLAVETARPSELIDQSLPKDRAPLTQKSVYQDVRELFMEFPEGVVKDPQDPTQKVLPMFFGPFGREVVFLKEFADPANSHPQYVFGVEEPLEFVKEDSHIKSRVIWIFGQNGPIIKKVKRVIDKGTRRNRTETTTKVADPQRELRTLSLIVNGSMP